MSAISFDISQLTLHRPRRAQKVANGRNHLQKGENHSFLRMPYFLPRGDNLACLSPLVILVGLTL